MTQTGDTIAATGNQRVRASDFQVIVRQLYRLYKVSALHLDNNEALAKTLAQSLSVFSGIRRLGLDYVSVLFLDDTVFVNGRLLKASLEVYGYAWQIAEFLTKTGYNELSIHCEVTETDIRAFLKLLSTAGQSREPNPGLEPVWQSGGFRLRRLAPRSLQFLKTDQLSPAERISRAYVTLLLVARDAWQRLHANEAVNLRPVRRAVQSLVRESAVNPVWFQYLARGRCLHDDPAGVATKQTMLAICMMRPLSSDEAAIQRVAFACIHHWLAHPWTAVVHPDYSAAPPPIVAPGTSGPHEALAPEAMLFGLLAGPINPGTLERLVVAFEAHLLESNPGLCPIPVTPSLVDLEPWIVLTAQRYARSMTFNVRQQAHLSPEAAIEQLVQHSRNRVEVLLARLLSVGLLLDMPPSLFEQSAAWWIDPPVTDSDVPSARFSGANSATWSANVSAASRRIETPIDQPRRPPVSSGPRSAPAEPVADSNGRAAALSPIQPSPTPTYPVALDTPSDLHALAQSSLPGVSRPLATTSLPPSNLSSRSTQDSAPHPLPDFVSARTLPAHAPSQEPVTHQSQTARVSVDRVGVPPEPPVARLAHLAQQTERTSAVRSSSHSPLHSPSSSPTVTVPNLDDPPHLEHNEPTRFLSSSSSPTVSVPSIDDWLESHENPTAQPAELPTVEHEEEPDEFELWYEQYQQREAAAKPTPPDDQGGNHL